MLIDADIMPEGIIQILSQFEKILLENNINSSECLQKAICAYVQSSQTKNSHLRSINLDNDISEKSIRYNNKNIFESDMKLN